MEDDATQILERAMKLDKEGRLTEAKICFHNGIEVLMKYLGTIESIENRRAIRTKIEEYMARAEAIIKEIDEKCKNGSYHEKTLIHNDSIGYSYESVFGRFFDNKVTSVIVEDPCICENYQLQNFLRFCELVVKKCPNLNTVELVTSEDEAEKEKQNEWLNKFKDELKDKHKVDLSFKFSSTLHDRQIKLSNGWTVKIDRGLNYFKHPQLEENKKNEEKSCCLLGEYDLDFRPCYETVVDVYH